MSHPRSLAATALCTLLATPALAQNVPVVFGTNWLAQAEHGGFYQSVADGTYAACGLDVTIQTGGPQVNNRALMLAGRIDYNMGGNLLEAFSAVQEGIPVVVVAASFQKEPQVILTHPSVPVPGKPDLTAPLMRVEILPKQNRLCTAVDWAPLEPTVLAASLERHRTDPSLYVWDVTTKGEGCV